jgi:hypothetical protein
MEWDQIAPDRGLRRTVITMMDRPVMLRALAATMLGAVLLAACIGPVAEVRCDFGDEACEAIWVLVETAQPPAGSDDHVLTIGPATYALPRDVGNGAAALYTTIPQQVRVWRATDCATILEFEAEPGSVHSLTIDETGAATHDEITGEPFPMGPGFEETDSPPCR